MAIDNRDLIPPYRADDAVTLEDGSPDWIKELIIEEVHIRRLTEEGTFAAAAEKLEYFAKLGVNCLWVTPINDRGVVGNGYGNLGINTVDPRLTGEISYDEPWRLTDYEKGFKVFKEFVDKAHSLNIRILLDVITWGAEDGCELFTTHPEWFVKGIRGMISPKSQYFNWANEDFCEWYISNAVEVVKKTGIDGFRFDLEPMYASYRVCGEIRRRVYETGRKIAMVSESPNERLGVFDFEQFGVCDRRTRCITPQRLFTADDIVDSYNNGCVENNIVDCIREGHGVGIPHFQWAHHAGTFRYYTSMLCCHDYHAPNVLASRLFFGYQGVFAPFIPLWFIGEEFNNPDITPENGCIFHNKIEWSLTSKGENGAFLEDVKKFIRIRRQYPEIFNRFEKSTRNANICKVALDGPKTIQAYARFADSKAIVIVPNRTDEKQTATYKVYVPFEEMGLDKKEYKVTDLLTDKEIGTIENSAESYFESTVDYDNIGVYLID